MAQTDSHELCPQVSLEHSLSVAMHSSPSIVIIAQEQGECEYRTAKRRADTGITPAEGKLGLGSTVPEALHLKSCSYSLISGHDLDCSSLANPGNHHQAKSDRYDHRLPPRPYQRRAIVPLSRQPRYRRYGLAYNPPP